MSTQTKKSFLKKIAERETAPETHLFKTIAFWASIAPPLLIGTGLALYAGIQEGKIWQFSTSGYNTFLKDFKLPIGVMGLAIPLGALAAAVHRSVQTSRQIMEQNQQNIFSNYLEHRRYFLTFVDEHKPFFELEFSAPHLYQRLFPDSADGPLNPDHDSLNYFLNLAHVAAMSCAENSADSLTPENFQIVDEDLAEKIFRSNEALSQFISVQAIEKDQLVKYPLSDLPQILRQNLEAAKGLIECANFHKNYIEFRELKALEENTDQCLNRIYSLQKLYHLWKRIHDELAAEAVSNPHRPLQNRLGNIKENMSTNRLTADDLDIIFRHHLSEEELETILNNGPDTWRILADGVKTEDYV